MGRRWRLHSSLSGPFGPRSRARLPLHAAARPGLAVPRALQSVRGLGLPGLQRQMSRSKGEGLGRQMKKTQQKNSHFLCVTWRWGKGSASSYPTPLSLSVTKITLNLYLWIMTQSRCVVQPTPLRRTPECVPLQWRGEGIKRKYTTHFLLHTCPNINFSTQHTHTYKQTSLHLKITSKRWKRPARSEGVQQKTLMTQCRKTIKYIHIKQHNFFLFFCSWTFLDVKEKYSMLRLFSQMNCDDVLHEI